MNKEEEFIKTLIKKIEEGDKKIELKSNSAFIKIIKLNKTNSIRVYYDGNIEFWSKGIYKKPEVKNLELGISLFKTTQKAIWQKENTKLKKKTYLPPLP